MSTTFVTALYHGLSGTAFEGRQGRRSHYLYSLCNLLHLGQPFIVHTRRAHAHEIIQWVAKNHLPKTRLRIEIEEPADLPHHQAIQRARLARPDHDQRFYELLYSKTRWLAEAIRTNPFRSENFFWIDAGLSYSGLFPPHCLRRTDYPAGDRRQYHDFAVFNADLHRHLVRIAADKIYCLVFDQTERRWSRYAPDKYFHVLPNLPKHMTGGVFGGGPQQGLWLAAQFEARLRSLLADNLLLSEEEIYTTLLNDYRDRFAAVEFNSWRHPALPEYDDWARKLTSVTVYYRALTEAER